MKSFGMGALSTTESFELGVNAYTSDFVTSDDGWELNTGTTPVITFNETSASGVDGMLQIVYPSGTNTSSRVHILPSNFDTPLPTTEKKYYFKMSIECEGDSDKMPMVRAYAGLPGAYFNNKDVTPNTLYTFSGQYTRTMTPTTRLVIGFDVGTGSSSFGDTKIRIKDIGWYYYD